MSLQTRRVRLDLLDALALKVPGLIGGSVVACLFALIWLRFQEASWASLAWLFLLIALNVPLAWMFSGYWQADEPRKVRIATLMALTRLAAGVLWSIGFWMIHQMPDADLFWFLVAIYCGIALSVVATQSNMPMAVIGFVAPPFLNILAIIAMRLDGMAMLLTGCLLAFFSIVLVIGRSIYRESVAAVVQRLDMEALNQTLQQQTQDLSAQKLLLEQTTTRLDRLVNLRDMVLAAASHDLRQPAQAISLIARSIQAESTSEGLRDKAHALETSSAHINNLIARLLDLARINEEDASIHKTWIDLDGFFTDIESMFRPLARLHGISLQLEPTKGAAVQADRHCFERLIHNLLTNAIEHSHGMNVRLTAHVLEQRLPTGTADRPVLELRLVDDGVGVDPGTLPAELLDPAGREIGRGGHEAKGPRLGLLIVARLASLGGFRVRFEPTSGPGTTFSLRFDEFRHVVDRSPAPAQAAAALVPPSRAKAGQTLLIIDDDRLIRYGLSLLLNARGFQVIAWDGLDDSLDEPPGDPMPSLLMVDWQLNQTATALQALGRLRHWLPSGLPVIVLAGTPPLGEQLDQLRVLVGACCVSVLHKPVHAAELEAEISRLLALMPARSDDGHPYQ